MLIRLLAPLGVLANCAVAYDVWCGKTYQATDPAMDPGGWLDAPAEGSHTLLDLRFRPRMNIYVDEYDHEASFIMATELSNQTGKWWYFDTDSLDYSIDMADRTVAKGTINLNESSPTEANFSLNGITPRFDPYEVKLTAVASSPKSNTSYIYISQFYYLPLQNSTGSTVRLDSLYGGISPYSTDHGRWINLFPYAYYVNWGGWLEDSLSNLEEYANLGYNLLHFVPEGGSTPFNVTTLNNYLDRCDELGLWVMYDMRWTYQNESLVTEQVNMLKTRKSLLLWYTGDEPDGAVDPQDATQKSGDHIRSLDPYHPISLCLNCYNYYYEAYSSGADILLSDVYPVGINATFSTVWNTTCNATYGDCGCDDCEGKWEDISVRLDRFAQYDKWLERSIPKTLWGVPQAFGEESYWPRYPTSDEEILMNTLSINHNAKAIVMWTFPTHADIANTTGLFAKALSADTVTDYLTGANAEKVTASGVDRVDVAQWTLSSSGTSLISVVYLGDEDTFDTVRIPLLNPMSVMTIWGKAEWILNGDEGLVKEGLTKNEVSIIFVESGSASGEGEYHGKPLGDEESLDDN